MSRITAQPSEPTANARTRAPAGARSAREAIANGRTAVMASRHEPRDSLEFFPTPPWATRALLEHVLWDDFARVATARHAWDPAAGEGHMAEVLAEKFAHVEASDVHDYGRSYRVGSFVGHGGLDIDVIAPPARCDWVITNPPFSLAEDFAARGLAVAEIGVALLVRVQWLHGVERHALFKAMPPSCVALFAERVPMVKGRWDPGASTATDYCWVVWRHRDLAMPETRLIWIPPGCRKALTKATDVQRFAAQREVKTSEVQP